MFSFNNVVNFTSDSSKNLSLCVLPLEKVAYYRNQVTTVDRTDNYHFWINLQRSALLVTDKWKHHVYTLSRESSLCFWCTSLLAKAHSMTTLRALFCVWRITHKFWCPKSENERWNVSIKVESVCYFAPIIKLSNLCLKRKILQYYFWKKGLTTPWDPWYKWKVPTKLKNA